MSSAHTVLMLEGWQAAPLAKLIRETVAPFDDGDQLNVGSRAAMRLTMAMHELSTNAAKFGALSVPSGRFSIAWQVRGEGLGQTFLMIWNGHSGPPVEPATSRGFGSTMIEQILAQQILGSLTLEFLPAGFQCVIKAPLEKLQQDGSAVQAH